MIVVYSIPDDAPNYRTLLYFGMESEELHDTLSKVGIRSPIQLTEFQILRDVKSSLPELVSKYANEGPIFIEKIL